MVGIGNTQLAVNLTTRDASLNRLNQTANGMSSASAGFVWNPTSKFIIKREETDRQNDDNLTFLFEYRALLNSRVQTLITQLSSALASDLEVAMSSSNAVWGNNRSAMNGLSTNTQEDAGAARTAYNFMTGWMPNASAVGTTALNPGAGALTPPSTSYSQTFTSTNCSIRVAGTAGLCQAITDKIDILQISSLDGSNGAPTFLFANQNADNAGLENVLDNSFSGPLGVSARIQRAKNLFQKVLFDALSSVEYRPVLNSGLFKNLIISASASLASGSQAQASISMNYEGTRIGGPLNINLDKLTCFYHS